MEGTVPRPTCQMKLGEFPLPMSLAVVCMSGLEAPSSLWDSTAHVTCGSLERVGHPENTKQREKGIRPTVLWELWREQGETLLTPFLCPLELEAQSSSFWVKPAVLSLI